MEYNEAEIFEYLSDLRDSGATNMFGAGEYLQEDYGMTKKEAREWVIRWMESFKGEG